MIYLYLFIDLLRNWHYLRGHLMALLLGDEVESKRGDWVHFHLSIPAS